MERNIRLDYYKIILSIMVVAIHIQPLFAEGSFLSWLIPNGISRIAVPSFFIISGYYIYPKLDNTKAVKKYILRLLTIYATWTLLYLSYYIEDYSYKNIAFYVLFGYGHLWYMPATIVGVSLVFLLKKIIKKDIIILCIAAAFYLASMIISNHEGINFFTVNLFRNGLTLGFLYTMIGCYIRAKEPDKKMTDKNLIIIISTFIILVLCEVYYRFHHLKNLGPYQDIMLFIPPLCTAIFILIIKHPLVTGGKGFINTLSSGIYFIHLFVISIISVPFAYGIYKFPIVLIATTVLSYIVYLINKRIKIFF